MHQCANRHQHRGEQSITRAGRILVLAGAIIALGFCGAGNAAPPRAKGPAAAARPAFARPAAPHAVGENHAALTGQQRGREFGRQPGVGPAGQGRGFEHGPAGFGRPGPGGSQGGLARNGLPRRPFPGEAGFTGVPPRGETRFVSNEMIVHVDAGVSPQALDAAARRLGLTAIGSQPLGVTGGTLVHFRLADGQQVADAVRTLEAERIGIAQPNYVFRLQQDAQRAPAPLPQKADPAQYVITKLRLAEAHRIATGANVLVAVIDSLIDTAHPDLAGSIVGQFDAVTSTDKPDEHGTGMTGAIVAHRKLLGVAPRARILAIHAFSPNAQNPQQATSQAIVAGIDRAIEKGARIINMSFAGPYDPVLQLALKKAHDKGVVLIAAAGNLGPQSPPLYPAADENVIAVTAVDENDKLLVQANQGPHIALAAPGVNVIETAPGGIYNFTTGTSVAAAHVSGVAALMLERNPAIDIATLENVLYSTAKDLGTPGRDKEFGYGLVDPYRALIALNTPDAKVALQRQPPAAGPLMPIAVATTAEKLPLGTSKLAPGPAAAPPEPTLPETATRTPLPTPKPVAGAAPSGKLTVSQVAGPSAVPGAPAATPEPDDAPAIIEKKRQACRQDGMNKGMRGADMADFVTVCVAEARLGCLKQAIAQKIRLGDRRDFMNRCLIGP